MIVFLIGYMGVGKSTIGRNLANALNYKFIDTDQWIESRMCMSVNDIFEKEGEDLFRLKEEECINFLLGNDTIVVATGGGLPCHNDLMTLMNQLGITVYLEASPDYLTDSLVQSKEVRPLLSQLKGRCALINFIEKHLASRNPFYRQAQYVMNIEDYKSIEQLTHLIHE